MSNINALLPSPVATGIRLPCLDGLRGVAIGFVLLAHGSGSIHLKGWWTHDFWLVFNNGHLGVMLFFVLSGFLITTLLKREKVRTGKIDLPAFYWRRTLRIFPALYSFLGLVVLLTSVSLIFISIADLILAATYTLNYRIFSSRWNPNIDVTPFDPKCWYVGHLWTLSIEEQFYLLWPTALVLGGLGGGVRLASLILVFEPFFRVITYFMIPPMRPYFSGMTPWSLDPFLTGALAALCLGEPWFENILSRFARTPLVLAAIFFLMIISPILGSQLRGFYSLGFSPTLESISILIVLLWLLRNPKTVVGQILNSRPMVGLGYLSYSLYLWQQLFLVFWPSKEIWQQFPFNYICCFLVAMLSYYLIEKPFLKMKEKVSISHGDLPVHAK